MNDKQPMYVMPEHVSRTLGKDAQRNNILAAKLVADIVKTTLGPKGMDKMLVDPSGNVIVTNDGVTILEEMEIDHPAAKMLVDIAKTQEHEVGDGTTTVALLAGKLLEHAEGLLDRKIHPTIIVEGYRRASERAGEVLKELGQPLSGPGALKQIAMTAMTGKGAEGTREHLSELLVGAVTSVREGNTFSEGDIKIEKVKGEQIVDSELVTGLVIAKERVHNEMPAYVEGARILLLDQPLEIRSPETETRLSISSPDQLESFIRAEERVLKEMTEGIIASGANVIFCQKGIDDVAQYYLARAGIFACRRVSKTDMEMLARATSGKIVSNLHEITPDQFGKAEIVEEVKQAEDSLIYIRGCHNPKAVSIVLRGSTTHVLDEVERALKDGLGDVHAAMRSGKVVAGGGAVEVEVARKLRIYASAVGGKEQLAIEAFARAMESIPEALAENAGLDPINILAALKKQHEMGHVTYGINLLSNEIEDTISAGIVEPLKVKTQAVSAASEVAMMILRIDDVLISSPRGQNQQSGPRFNEFD